MIMMQANLGPIHAQDPTLISSELIKRILKTPGRQLEPTLIRDTVTPVVMNEITKQEKCLNRKVFHLLLPAVNHQLARKTSLTESPSVFYDNQRDQLTIARKGLKPNIELLIPFNKVSIVYIH